jgi:ABC-type antimicrobial peptide transport system permease subunit
MIWESVRTGAVEIYSHKTRSFLSFAAIAFGVAAILYTFAHVNRMVTRRKQAFELAGPGRIRLNKKWQRGASESPGLSKGLTSSDAQVIRKAVPGLYMVSPHLSGRAELQYRNFKESVQLKGITMEWKKRQWVYTVKGRFFNQHDLDNASRVCILNEPGGWIKKPFWMRFMRWGAGGKKFQHWVKRVELVGSKIRLDDQIFTVVGVLVNPPQDRDPRWFDRSASEVYLPLSTAQRYFNNEMRGGDVVPDAISDIAIDTGDEKTVATAMQRIKNLLDVRHRGEDDFELQDWRETIQHILNRQREAAVQILSVGIVAILAGGVGIMNVTLATIFSRIREIGIRRAVGATRADILMQFVTEAMLLGALGGVAGIMMGILGIKHLARDGAENMEALLAWHYAATLAISVFAGFIFSLYPAYQASKLDPVEALRYE